MEIRFIKEKIEFKKELNALDKFVVDFTPILNNLNIKYVLVSGYVSILFGRNRSSEDVDIIIEKLTIDTFKRLWGDICKNYECINTDNSNEAYNEYLLNDNAVRFARKGEFIPNMEVKFVKTELDKWTLTERKEVIMNNHKLFVSPLELQIPFKLFLGSEKDIEDAKYIYNLFKRSLDMKLLLEFNRKLKIEKLFNKHISQ